MASARLSGMVEGLEAALRGARREAWRAAPALAAGVWGWAAFPQLGFYAWVAAASAAAVWHSPALAVMAAFGGFMHVYQGEYMLLWADMAALAASSAVYAARSRLSRGPYSLGVAAASVAIAAGPLLATLYIVKLFLLLLESVERLPLTMREVLYPIEASAAGRFAVLLVLAGVSSALAARLLSLVSVAFGGVAGARRLALEEARAEVEDLVNGRDYAFTMLRETYVMLAAILVMPAVGVAVDLLTNGLKGAPEPLRAVSPFLYFIIGWGVVRLLAPSPLFKGLRAREPGPRSTLLTLAIVAAGLAAVALATPGGRGVAAAALGLGGDDPTAQYASAVEGEYLDRLRSLVAILEFAVRFFGGG